MPRPKTEVPALQRNFPNSEQDHGGTAPLVSVVIPTFNSGTFVRGAVESVLRQTYRPVEIIVVNDGSTDDTPVKLADYITTGDIRYVSQENRGLSAARNVGLEMAEGKYVQFLDADDLLAPSKIEKQVKLLEQSGGTDICASDFRFFTDTENSPLSGGDEFCGQFPIDNAEQIFAFQTVIHRWLFPASAVREVGGFQESRPDVWVMEDWLLLWTLVASGTKILYVDEPLALYRRHATNMTSDIPKAAKGHFIALDRVEEYQRTHQCNFYSRSQLRALRESYHYELGLHYVRSNQIYRAYRELLRALRLSPKRRQAKLLLLAAAPILRSRAIDWTQSPDRLLWRFRGTASRGLRSANLFSERSRLRNYFYQWRQRRPLRRVLATAALAATWPIAWIGKRLRAPLTADRGTRRILLFHLGGLGDTLMLTPALRALRENYPQARIDLITLHEHVRDAFRAHPCIDSIVVLPSYSGRWIVSQFEDLGGARLVARTIRYYPELLLGLLLRRYDLAINFGLANFERRVGNAIMRCLGIPIRIGVAAESDRLVTHPISVNQPQRHRVEAYVRFLAPLSITNASTDYEYPIAQHDLQQVKFALRDRRIDQTRRMAVIHPGGTLHVNSRRWPAEYFAKVCDFLSGEGWEVVLTGDDQDAAACDEVGRQSQTQIVSMCGDFTFSQTAALLSLSDLVITNDTATLHLAEAVKAARVVSIFGPTDATLLAPKNDRHIVFRSHLPCAPCMGGTIDAVTERCWRDVKEECLWQTTPHQIIAVLRGLFGKHATRVASA